MLSQTISWDSYEDIWKWCLSHDYGERYLHDIRAIIGILEEFHIYGIMPNNRTTQNPLCPRENAYSKLVPEYKQMVDFAYEAEKRRGRKPDTLKCTKSKASSFLYSLQSRGADRLKKVTETDVLAYFLRMANICGGGPRLRESLCSSGSVHHLTRRNAAASGYIYRSSIPAARRYST